MSKSTKQLIVRKSPKQNTASKKARFELNEKVWACDKGVYYDAKVLRCESIGSMYKYFIHYTKWDRKYDTWLDEVLLEPYNNGINPKSSIKSEPTGKKSKIDPSTLTLFSQSVKSGTRSSSANANNSTVTSNEESAHECKEAVSVATTQMISKSSKSKIQTDSNSTSVRKMRKELANSDLMQDDDEESFTFRYNIPCDLKRHLVDEWILITQNAEKRFVKLPRDPKQNVMHIIEQFLDEKQGKFSSAQFKALKEILSGFVTYFDKALPRILLYRQERSQYDALVAAYPHTHLSELYGGEHLLRLYVRLPRLLSGVFALPAELSEVHSRLGDLLKFLHKHASEYLSISEYVPEAESVVICVKKTKNIHSNGGGHDASQIGKRRKTKDIVVEHELKSSDGDSHDAVASNAVNTYTEDLIATSAIRESSHVGTSVKSEAVHNSNVSAVDSDLPRTRTRKKSKRLDWPY